MDVSSNNDSASRSSIPAHSSGQGAASRSESKVTLCQVQGCKVDLVRLGKAYCLKKKLCQKHLKADSIQRRNVEGSWRFCQQCGKLEQLEAFEGLKRSCRVGLQKKRDQSNALALKKQQQQALMQEQEQVLMQETQQQQYMAAAAAAAASGGCCWPSVHPIDPNSFWQQTLPDMSAAGAAAAAGAGMPPPAAAAVTAAAMTAGSAMPAAPEGQEMASSNYSSGSLPMHMQMRMHGSCGVMEIPSHLVDVPFPAAMLPTQQQQLLHHTCSNAAALAGSSLMMPAQMQPLCYTAPHAAPNATVSMQQQQQAAAASAAGMLGGLVLSNSGLSSVPAAVEDDYELDPDIAVMIEAELLQAIEEVAQEESSRQLLRRQQQGPQLPLDETDSSLAICPQATGVAPPGLVPRLGHQAVRTVSGRRNQAVRTPSGLEAASGLPSVKSMSCLPAAPGLSGPEPQAVRTMSYCQAGTTLSGPPLAKTLSCTQDGSMLSDPRPAGTQSAAALMAKLQSLAMQISALQQELANSK